MVTDQIISISDLRVKTSTYIKSLKDDWDKYIFINNKPKAVLVDVNRYEKLLEIAKNNTINSCINDEKIIWSINDVFWWEEKELTFW